MDRNSKILSDLTVYSKYARFLEGENRRETFEEIIDRNKRFWLEKYPNISDDIEKAYQLVLERKVLPSMRTLQFAGAALDKNCVRGFNCSYTSITDYRDFSEIMFLLLAGVGVGYSVQKHHVAQLPALVLPSRARKYIIADSIEGWADSVRHLMKAFMESRPLPRFDYSEIRPKGTKISSGGLAPGPEPLRRALTFVESLLREKIETEGEGCKLTPLECHDIICVLANAVLAGGVRRSALISLFSKDDHEMMSCKDWDKIQGNEHRYRSNNSVVLLRNEVTEEEFKSVWKKVRESGSGEPGIFLSNDLEMGGNPCVPGNETVLTPNGVGYVNDLIGTPFQVPINNRLHDSTVKGFYSTGIKPVYEIQTKEGYKIRATGKHKIRYNQYLSQKKRVDDWKELRDLIKGDRIVLNNCSETDWNGRGSFAEGYTLGSLQGDGTFHNKTAYLCYWTDHEKEVGLHYAKQSVNARKDFGKGKGFNGRYQIGSTALKEKAEEFGIVPSKVIDRNKCEIGTSSEFYKGFLQGWFDADGSVMGTTDKGISVRLGSIHKNNLEIAQRMLLHLGIASTLYKRREEGQTLLPNGKGGLDYYNTKTAWELVISCSNLHIFQNRIGFSHKDKKERLTHLLNSYKRKPNKEQFLATVESINYIGVEEVYDCTIPEVSCFDCSGVIAHNCNEIGLKSKELCNLTEVNVDDVESQEDFMTRVWGATVLGTLQATLTDYHYLSNEWRKNSEEEALLGVSMTGIASGKVLKLDIKQAALHAVETNRTIASLIGINPAARVTTVKPAGTTSIVVGSSSGAHPWHAPYYIRRVRLRSDEPLALYLSKNHPEIVTASLEKPDEELIIEIPIKAPEGSIFRSESSIESALPRVKRLYDDWIKTGHISGNNTHNVSYTLTVKNDEWDEVIDWLWNNKDSYCGITVFPEFNGFYAQAPFEDIDEEEYNRRTALLKDFDITQVKELVDNTQLEETVACSGGACEVNFL